MKYVSDVLEFFFPQIEVNKKFPYTEHGKKKWCWIKRKQTKEQAEYIAQSLGEYYLRWLILFFIVVWASVHLGPTPGSFLFLVYVFLSGWTLFGVTYAYVITKKKA